MRVRSEVAEIVVADAGPAGADRDAGQGLSFRPCRVGRQLDLTGPYPVGSGGSDVLQEGLAGTHQADRGRDELAADGRGIADQIEQLAAGFRPHDRFVGRAQRREHPPQLFLLLLGPRLLVGAVETAERIGDVVGEPLQQLGEFGRERVALGGDEQHHADRLVVDDQWKRRAGSRILAIDNFAERAVGDIAEEIVVDAGAPGTERLAADTTPFGTRIAARDVKTTRILGSGACDRDHLQEIVAGLRDQDAGGIEPAAMRRRRANQLVHLDPRPRTHDRLVGRAERGEHPRQPLTFRVRLGFLGGAAEIIERDRDVLGDPREQRDDLLVARPGIAGEEDQDADAAAESGQRQRDTGHQPAAADRRLRRAGRGRNVVLDAWALGSKRLAANALAVDIVGVGRKPRLCDQVDRLAGAGDGLEPVGIGFGEQHHRGEGFAAEHRGVADPLIQIVLGLGAKDRLVGGADRAEHAVEPTHRPLTALARRFMVEIVEREGYVRRHALEQRDDLLAERVDLAPRHHENADAAPATDQRHRRSCANAAGRGAAAPGRRAGIIDVVVADTGRLVAERPSGDAFPFRRVGERGNRDAAEPRDILAVTGRECQQTGIRLQQEHGRGQEAPAGERGFTDLAVQFVW